MRGRHSVKKAVHRAIPANTGHSPNAVSMLGQHRRRCVNIETALGECPVFAGMLPPPPPPLLADAFCEECN